MAAPARHARAPERAGGGRDQAEAVVDVADGHVVGPAVVRALEDDAVVALVEEVRLLRGLHGLQGQALHARSGQRLHVGRQLGVPFGAYVERERAFEGDLAALHGGDAHRPLVGDVRGQFRLVVPGVRLGARPAAGHVLQEGVAGVVGESEQDQGAGAQCRGVRDRHRPGALAGRGDGGERTPLVAPVAGPALEGPRLRPDRGDEGVPTGRRRKPDEAAGPGPGRLVAAVAGAVGADQFGEVAGGVQLGAGAAGAAEDHVRVADADDVVDAERAGRDGDRATAGPSGGGDGTVDRGGGVGRSVGHGAEVPYVGHDSGAGEASRSASVAGPAYVGDLGVGVRGAVELSPYGRDLGCRVGCSSGGVGFRGGRVCDARCRRAECHGRGSAEQGPSGEMRVAHVRTPSMRLSWM